MSIAADGGGSPPPVIDAPDGKGYVTAAIDAGQRSRTIIYFIIILILVTFTSIRNQYTPDWMQVRAAVHRELHHCLLSSSETQLESCKAFRTRVKEAGIDVIQAAKNWGFSLLGKTEGTDKEADIDVIQAAKDLGWVSLRGKIGDADFERTNKVVLDEINVRGEAFLKKDIDLYTISIPLLGSVIDINDLWLISGVVMFFLLYLLRASFEQEYRNIVYIGEHKRDFVPIVVMNQLLAALGAHPSRFYRILQYLFGLSPTWLYLFLFVQDCKTYNVSLMYVGSVETYVEYGMEIGAVSLVLYLNFKCIQSQKKIRDIIGELTPAHSLFL